MVAAVTQRCQTVFGGTWLIGKYSCSISQQRNESNLSLLCLPALQPQLDSSVAAGRAALLTESIDTARGRRSAFDAAMSDVQSTPYAQQGEVVCAEPRACDSLCRTR